MSKVSTANETSNERYFFVLSLHFFVIKPLANGTVVPKSIICMLVVKRILLSACFGFVLI
jgi:hypothetical protein